MTAAAGVALPPKSLTLRDLRSIWRRHLARSAVCMAGNFVCSAAWVFVLVVVVWVAVLLLVDFGRSVLRLNSSSKSLRERLKSATSMAKSFLKLLMRVKSRRHLLYSSFRQLELNVVSGFAGISGTDRLEHRAGGGAAGGFCFIFFPLTLRCFVLQKLLLALVQHSFGFSEDRSSRLVVRRLSSVE